MWWIAIGLVLVAGIAVLAITRPGGFSGKQEMSEVERQQKEREQAAQKPIADSKAELAKQLGISEDDLELVGGVWRPKRDIQFDRSVKATGSEDSDKPQSVADFLPKTPQPGIAPRLKGDENAQVAGLLAEIRGNNQEDVAATTQETAPQTNDRRVGDQSLQPGDNPRVVSSWFKPEAFDREAYLANPEAYLNLIRPSRVFDPAQPGEDVVPLEPISNGFHEILQGEQVVLKVQAEAGMPVAFYTPQVGHFTENQLKSVTVKADDEGIATATFNAATGSMGVVDVMAASPVHSRQLQFRVNVLLPEQNRAAEN